MFDRLWPERRVRAEQRALAIGAIRDALERDDAGEALRLARLAVRDGEGDPEAYRVAADALARYGDRDAGELFARAADAPADVTRAFELGSYLLANDEPELAASVLSRAVELAPFDAVIRCELAVALARSGRPADVVATLVLHPDLAGDPGALFELAWASLLTFDIGSAARARHRLAELGSARALLAKLDAALARSAIVPERTPPSARDYYFLEHGALLLDAGGPGRGRYATVRIDAERLGRLRALAARAFDAIGVEIGRVETVDVELEPFARALADSLRDRGRLAGERRLLLGRDAATMEPVPGVLTFVLTLDPTASAPFAPDFVGVMAESVEWAGGGAVARGDVDARELVCYAEARRAYLPPVGVRVMTAFVPDAPRD